MNEVLSVQTINVFTTTNLLNLSENFRAINVTSNNEIDKFISGNFNAKTYKIVQPPATTTETKNLTNGLFTNIDYVTSNNTNIFKYKINNVPFPGNNPDASSTGYYQKNNVKWLKTLSDGYENVSFGIKNDIVVGSYPLSLNPADMINGFYKINGILYKATSGTVKITAVTASSISGIFNFSATNAVGTQTVVISEGEFSLFK